MRPPPRAQLLVLALGAALWSPGAVAAGRPASGRRAERRSARVGALAAPRAPSRPEPPRAPPAPPARPASIREVLRTARRAVGAGAREVGRTFRSPAKLARLVGTSAGRMATGLVVFSLTHQPEVAAAATYVAGHIVDRAADRLLPSTRATPRPGDRPPGRLRAVAGFAAGMALSASIAHVADGLAVHWAPQATRVVSAMPAVVGTLVTTLGVQRMVGMVTNTTLNLARAAINLVIQKLRRGRDRLHDVLRPPGSRAVVGARPGRRRG